MDNAKVIMLMQSRFSQDLELIDMNLPIDAINMSMCKLVRFDSVIKLMAWS